VLLRFQLAAGRNLADIGVVYAAGTIENDEGGFAAFKIPWL